MNKIFERSSSFNVKPVRRENFDFFFKLFLLVLKKLIFGEKD